MVSSPEKNGGERTVVLGERKSFPAERVSMHFGTASLLGHHPLYALCASQVRLWKVLEDSHLVFRPVGGGSIDCVRCVVATPLFNTAIVCVLRSTKLSFPGLGSTRLDQTTSNWPLIDTCLISASLVLKLSTARVVGTYRMLNEDWFTTGGEDGSLALWFAMKKKPAVLVPAAHGYGASGVPRWISAIGCLKQSDLVVSGSNDGAIRLWRADVEARSLEQVSRMLRLACFVGRGSFRRRGCYRIPPSCRLGRDAVMR